MVPFFPVASLSFTEPPHLEALLSSPDGKELVAAWTELVSSCQQATEAAAAAAAAAADRARGGKAKAGAKAGASKGGSCGGGGGGGADTAAAAAAAAVKHLLQRVHTDLGGRGKVRQSSSASLPRWSLPQSRLRACPKPPVELGSTGQGLLNSCSLVAGLMTATCGVALD